MAVTRKVVAIGPEEELAFLKGAGVEFVPLADGERLADVLRDRAGDAAVALVLISETLAQDRQEMVAQMRQRTGKLLLVVPSHRGSVGSTQSYMRHVLEQSIGVDLLSKD